MEPLQKLYAQGVHLVWRLVRRQSMIEAMPLQPHVVRWSGVAPRAAIAARDARIDFFRGLALLFIFIDHVPGNVLSRLTLHNFGLSDAAEVFVLLAGVSSALAYAGRRQALTRIWKRVRTIYIAHIALLIVAAGMLHAAVGLGGLAALAKHPALAPFTQDFGHAMLRVVTLDLQPEFIDILPLYMFLLGWAPIFLWIAARSKRLALFISVLIWLSAGVFAINMPGHRQGGWFFNPFAWQLLFSVGLLIGLQDRYRISGRRLPRSPALLALAAAGLVLGLLYAAPWTQVPIGSIRHLRIIPADLLGEVSKTYASIWRLIHILCLAYVVAWCVPHTAAWLNHRWALAISHLGRKPLTIFFMASLFSIGAAIAMTAFGRGLIQQLALNAIGLSCLMAIGWQQRGAPRAALHDTARPAWRPAASSFSVYSFIAARHGTAGTRSRAAL